MAERSLDAHKHPAEQTPHAPIRARTGAMTGSASHASPVIATELLPDLLAARTALDPAAGLSRRASAGARLQQSAGNQAVQRLLRGEARRGEADAGSVGGADLHEAAREGVAGSASTLPFLDRIQQAFGPGHDLSTVRAHVDSRAAEASAAIDAEAYTTGEHVAFQAPPRLQTAAHEAAHVIQQRGGVSIPEDAGRRSDAYERHAEAIAERVAAGAPAADLLAAFTGGGRTADAPVVQRQQPSSLVPAPTAATGPAPQGKADLSGSPAHPLANYFLLFTVLKPEDVDNLENAAKRREALRRGQQYDGPAGAASASGPLTDFLPPAATYVSREEAIKQYGGFLGDEHGPSSASSFFATLIAKNEALRLYLDGKKDKTVVVELTDPDGHDATATRLRFTVDGKEVAERNGTIPVESLDVISATRLGEIADRTAAAAAQLVTVAVADAKGRYVITEAQTIAREVRQKPGQYPVKQVDGLAGALDSYYDRVTALRKDLKADNSDQAARLSVVLTDCDTTRKAVRDAATWLRTWQAPSIPEQTAGEWWWQQQREEEARMSANVRIGGGYYAYLPLNALSWALIQVYRGAGNFVTLGNMEREATNAWMYRTGQLSNAAYAENIWWNLGVSAITGVIMVLTAGWGGRLAGMALGLEASQAAPVVAAGMGEGLVGGATTALGADVYNTIVGNIRGGEVGEYLLSQRAGPSGWLASGTQGMAIGGGISWGMARFSTPGPIFITRPRPGGGVDIIQGEVLPAPTVNELLPNLPPEGQGLSPFAARPGAGPVPLIVEPTATPAPAAGGTTPVSVPGGAAPLTVLPSTAVAPRLVTLPSGAPRISPIVDVTGTPFGASEYLASGAPAHQPVLYTEAAGKVVPIRAPSPEVTVSPTGEISFGTPPPSPARVVLGPSGDVVFSTSPAFRRPGTDIVLWGDQGWSRVPGNVPFTSATTGRAGRFWQFYESQGQSYMSASPSERNVTVPLDQPMQFSGRGAPQATVEPDVALQGRAAYGEMKMRQWEHPSERVATANALDLAGSLERMYVASGIEARVTPGAASAEFVVVSSRPLPAATNRLVMGTAARWMLNNGFSASAVYDFLSRVRFVRLNPTSPRQ